MAPASPRAGGGPADSPSPSTAVLRGDAGGEEGPGEDASSVTVEPVMGTAGLQRTASTL